MSLQKTRPCRSDPRWLIEFNALPPEGDQPANIEILGLQGPEAHCGFSVVLPNTAAAIVRSSAVSASRFLQQPSNPIARRRFVHAFPFGVQIGGPRPALEQESDDAELLLACRLRTGATTPCGLNGKMQRRRASLVRLPRIGSAVYQRSHGG